MSDFLSLSVADVASRTVDALRDMVAEVPAASSIEDLSDTFLSGDRKIYSGIVLGVLALLVMMLAF